MIEIVRGFIINEIIMIDNQEIEENVIIEETIGIIEGMIIIIEGTIVIIKDLIDKKDKIRLKEQMIMNQKKIIIEYM